MFRKLFIFLFAAALIYSCNSNYTSKKRGYFKIEYPEKKYRLFDSAGIPYVFEYPAYARIVQDSTYFDNDPEAANWVNIDFPQFNARIFLSYKKIGGKALYKIKTPSGVYKDSFAANSFDKMVSDAFKLTFKSGEISNSMKDSLLQTPNHLGGVLFKVGGDAATARQFFLTDTTRNFLRGALYFNTQPNSDSLKPVIDFLHADILKMMQTFRWK